MLNKGLLINNKTTTTLIFCGIFCNVHFYIDLHIVYCRNVYQHRDMIFVSYRSPLVTSTCEISHTFLDIFSFRVCCVNILQRKCYSSYLFFLIRIRVTKNTDGNFVKINLKKKSHVKGFALRGAALRKHVSGTEIKQNRFKSPSRVVTHQKKWMELCLCVICRCTCRSSSWRARGLAEAVGGAEEDSEGLTDRETSAINVVERDTGHGTVVEQVRNQKSVQGTVGKPFSLVFILFLTKKKLKRLSETKTKFSLIKAVQFELT